eukprot:4440773-Pleurochrysis_carterae.AAC.1
MQSPQPSIITPAPSPAPIDHSSITDPTTIAQGSSVAQPPTNTQQTASTSGPPTRRLRSIGHVPDPRGLLATAMHVNDFDDSYLPLARINDDMLLCLHTTAASASDVLPPPNNYILSRPDKEKWRVACMEGVQGQIANDTFDL